MKVGDLVVYVKGGVNTWKQEKTKKGIWEVIDKRYDNIRVKSLVHGKEFISNKVNLLQINEVITLGMLNKNYIVATYLDFFNQNYFILNSSTGSYVKRGKKDFVREIDQTHIFDTYTYNKYIVSDKDLKNTINKINKSNKLKDKTMQIVDDNAEAAKIAAKITVGKTLNSTLIKKIKPQLPMLVRGYTDSVLADVVIANIANFAVQNFFGDNEKAVYAADAMMQAAMVEFMAKVNIEEILSSLLSGVTIPDSATKESL